MTAAAYDIAAPCPDAIHRRTACSKDPAIKYRVARAAGKRNVFGIETDDIRKSAFDKAWRCDAKSLRSASHRAFEQPAAGGGHRSGQDVACPMRQPLRIFELAQIRTLESEPTPNTPPRSQNSAALNVPSPRLASVIGHNPATAPLCARRAISPAVACVA